MRAALIVEQLLRMKFGTHALALYLEAEANGGPRSLVSGFEELLTAHIPTITPEEAATIAGLYKQLPHAERALAEEAARVADAQRAGGGA